MHSSLDRRLFLGVSHVAASEPCLVQANKIGNQIETAIALILRFDLRIGISCLAFFVFMVTLSSNAIGNGTPILTDERMELTLFAEDPDIATPIGMVIDNHDRLFLIESHTHHPPADYDGPKDDRIKLFIDANGDGHPESAWASVHSA